MQVLFYEDRMVAEGASVVGLAAVLAGKVRPEGPVGTIVTGRNLDMGQFHRIMAGEDISLGDRNLKGKTYGA
jgi:threonine dehydratase